MDAMPTPNGDVQAEEKSNNNGHFSNTSVDISQSPSIENLDLHGLAPQYRRVNLCLSLAIFGFVISVGCLIYFQPFIALNEGVIVVAPWALSALSLYTLFSSLYSWFADPIKQYALREHDLHYQSGLFFRSVVTQPILRIQHIEIKRGPVERLTDMASLQVFSAGGGAHTFEIPGLLPENAVQLRAYILQHKASVEAL